MFVVFDPLKACKQPHRVLHVNEVDISKGKFMEFTGEKTCQRKKIVFHNSKCITTFMETWNIWKNVLLSCTEHLELPLFISLKILN